MRASYIITVVFFFLMEGTKRKENDTFLQMVTIQVDVLANVGYPHATAWFSGWFDWNLNGAFEPGEQTINHLARF